MDVQRTIADFRLHEAPQMDTLGENDPKRDIFQLLGMLVFFFLM